MSQNLFEESPTMDISSEATTTSHSDLCSPNYISPDNEKSLVTNNTTENLGNCDNINNINDNLTHTFVEKHPLMISPELSPVNKPTLNFPDIVPNMEKPGEEYENDSEKFEGRKQHLVDDSPEDCSCDSEDVSQFQATVEPTFQSVTLISTSGYKSNYLMPTTRRKITLSNELLSDDCMSSLDTLSNRSFDDDDDLERNIASCSPSSSQMEGFVDTNDDKPTTTASIQKPTTKTKFVEPIPVYTETEERRDSRNWQKITLPDGKTHEIDMKVIEPYKRVLSHGGYLKSGGHNAIVLFSACHLPDKSRTDYHYVMTNLFLYVVNTLEQLVTEDYVLIYLHGGSKNVPPFPWLKKCYQLIDRRLRKSLKHLFLVHPTFWLKSIVWMSRPFISSKFWRKMIYVKSLDELYNLVPNLERTAVPDKVKSYDVKFT